MKPLEENDGKIKTEIIKNIIDVFLKKGGTLDHLASQYEIYPTLTVLCPEPRIKRKFIIKLLPTQ